MKKIKINLLLLGLSFLLFSCNPNSENLQEGTITGTIENYTPGSIDKIEASSSYINDKSSDNPISLGVGTTKNSGKFSINLIDVPATYITYSENWAKLFDKKVSNDTIEYDADFFKIEAYKGTMKVGYIVKTNATYSLAPYDLGLYLDNGVTLVYLLYSKSSFTIKGIYKLAYCHKVFNFNVDIKQGWNEVARTIQKDHDYTTFPPNYHEFDTYTYTTNIPTDVKWRYFSY
ncbi:MAG: hypothetical protein PHR83_15025 [Paludibacter sp.]|nr:hypothetical protein [Paludibacter sp.]